MVFPLFAMALLWDRFQLGERRFLQARPVRLRIAGRTLVTNTINVAVAAGFTVMGGFVIYLANTGQMTGGAGFQVAIGRGLSRLFRRIETWTAPVPEPLLGLAVLGVAGIFVYATLRDRRRPLPEQVAHSCHDEQPAAPADQHTV
jgi:cytochrome c-type biogenesis protein